MVGTTRSRVSHFMNKFSTFALAQEEDVIGEYGFFRPSWEESR
jgi:hypothetical protein